LKNNNPTLIKAVVTDGLWRKSVSVIRSLGRAGYEVSVMGNSIFTTGFWSRYTRRRTFSQTAEYDPVGFGRNLMKLLLSIKDNPKPILLPMEDATLLWVTDHYEEVIQHAHVLIPSKESLAVAEDKASTLKLAQELGLLVPQTWEPQDAAEMEEIIRHIQWGEFVIKPRSGSGSAGIIYAKPGDPIDCHSHWEKYGKLIIQERIPANGRAIGVSLLMDQDGDCVAHFAHQRIRQYPVSGGPSTDRESIHAPELVESSRRLLEALSWKGVAMVEWKVDPVAGVPKLMEINPRFWGSLELAVRCGVDFPKLYAQAALGQVSKIPPTYEDGIRCRWVIPGDILRYISEKKQNRETLRQFLKGLPAEAEEWNPQDIRGSLACMVCPALLVVNPRYWKYMKRNK